MVFLIENGRGRDQNEDDCKKANRGEREQIVSECRDMLPVMLFVHVQTSNSDSGTGGITRTTCELHLTEGLFL